MKPDTAWEWPQTVASSVRVADKLHDFLMNPKSRPDLQTPEGQRWLKLLDRMHEYIGPKFDPLTPWMTREWKKGRIQHSEDGSLGHPYYMGTGPDPYSNRQRLNSDILGHWSDFLQSNHPVRRQLGDIMAHEVQPFHDQVKAWDQAMLQEAHAKALEGGQVAHVTPDGWSVRQLTTPDELKAEGDAMGHCVGGYHDIVANGNTMIYSLRDPSGTPHVTTEIRPQYVDWHGHRINRDNLSTLAEADEADAQEHGKPIPHQGNVVQIQGRANQEPKDEYKARLADWFRSFSPEERPTWEDDGAYDDYIHDDDGYSHSRIDHPDLIPQLQQRDGGLALRTEPTEDDYGLIRQPSNIPADYDDLLSNIKFHDYGGQGSSPDGDHIQDIYRLARERGQIPELAEALGGYQSEQDEDLDRWMDQNYEYAPRYPDEPTGWEGAEDEWGEPEHFDQETEGARPYWQIRYGPHDPYNDKYYDQAEAEKAYDEDYAQWQRDHAGTNAVNQMYNLLTPHSYNNTWNAEPEPQPPQPEQVNAS